MEASRRSRREVQQHRQQRQEERQQQEKRAYSSQKMNLKLEDVGKRPCEGRESLPTPEKEFVGTDHWNLAPAWVDENVLLEIAEEYARRADIIEEDTSAKRM